MGFYMWVSIAVIAMAVTFTYILMAHFTRAIRMVLEAFATFIEVIGMHNENAERFRLKEGPAYDSAQFQAEADRLRKLMNVSSMF